MNEPPISPDLERTIEFEFVRATENAALNVLPWLGEAPRSGRRRGL